MARQFTNSELEAYLDEALPMPEMAAIERELRGRPELVHQLAALNARRDAGLHTLGEIWRRHRASCPTREQLGSFLLGALPTEVRDYTLFHVKTIGCRFCQANLDDMKHQQQEASADVATRRTRYFQSSAGYLRGKK
jgi:hypothetical protein